MKLRGPFAAAMAAVLLGAAPRPPALTIYSAPAADRPAGASRIEPTSAVLPDGRTASPLGTSVFVGTNPMGVALSPDGRFAIVSNDEQDASLAPPPPTPELRAGYSLSIVDTRTMRVASAYQAQGITFFCGVAALRDPSDASSTLVLASDGANNVVRTFALSAQGVLSPKDAIPVPGFPAAIALSADNRIAYVTSNVGNTVTAIDIATHRALHSTAVGFSPFGVVAAGSNLVVANGGLDAYAQLAQPARAPRFAAVGGNPYRSSSLSVVPLETSGDLATYGAGSVRMDPMPDGVDVVGGARPDAVVTRGDYAYVSLANVDRVATVSLRDSRVVDGIDLRLYVGWPYGSQPDAEVLSPDGKRLYVALAGLNAVAVIDARETPTLHRLGLIPTGSLPSALAMSPDGRYLYVTNARGVDGWGLLQRVDLRKLPLREATFSSLRYNRTASAAHANAVVPPLRSGHRSAIIDHVVYISVGVGTFDSVFGDLGRGNGDPASVSYNDTVAPNLRSLAKAYAIADNFYVDSMNTDVNTQFSLAGMTTAYAERTLHVNAGRAPLDTHGADPEDYARAGYLFNALRRQNVSYRDYGALLNVSGYQPSSSSSSGSRGRPRTVDTTGLGGAYTLDVPALAALDGKVDLSYAGWNPAIPNATRAAEFVADMGRLVQSDQEPAFSYVWLPASGAGMAEADRALGSIVQFLSHTPHWSSTAVFIVAEGAAGTRDHVNRSRSYALVVSPVAKPAYVGHHHISLASVLKTEEELLGLPPTSLGDFLATDMADFFGVAPYPNFYQAIP